MPAQELTQPSGASRVVEAPLARDRETLTERVCGAAREEIHAAESRLLARLAVSEDAVWAMIAALTRSVDELAERTA
jgi:hypothetical protein